MKTVYSLPDCPGCENLRRKLEADGVEFKYVVIGEEITMAEFREKYPAVRAVPYVVETDLFS